MQIPAVAVSSTAPWVHIGTSIGDQLPEPVKTATAKGDEDAPMQQADDTDLPAALGSPPTPRALLPRIPKKGNGASLHKSGSASQTSGEVLSSSRSILVR